MVEGNSGAGDRETGRKGAGGVREAGEEGAGSRIPKVAGSGRKREKLRNNCALFRNQKNAKRQEPTNTLREPGLKGTGSGRSSFYVRLTLKLLSSYSRSSFV